MVRPYWLKGELDFLAKLIFNRDFRHLLFPFRLRAFARRAFVARRAKAFTCQTGIGPICL